MRSARLSVPAIFLLTLLLLSASPTLRVNAAFTAYACEDNACPRVTLTWDLERQQFRADNSFNRQAKVELTTFAGQSVVNVQAHKSKYLEVKFFNGPYHETSSKASARSYFACNNPPISVARIQDVRAKVR